MLCEDLPIIDEKGDLNEYYLEMLVSVRSRAKTAAKTLSRLVEDANACVSRILQGNGGW